MFFQVWFQNQRAKMKKMQRRGKVDKVLILRIANSDKMFSDFFLQLWIKLKQTVCMCVHYVCMIWVARFFLVHHTKTGNNKPNDH
jgi:hypothetical protein